MESLLPILIWIVVGVIVASLAIILVVGLRNVIWGKIEVISLVSMLATVIVTVIFGVIMGPAKGLIAATLVMLLITLLALMLSGVRGLFS